MSIDKSKLRTWTDRSNTDNAKPSHSDLGLLQTMVDALGALQKYLLSLQIQRAAEWLRSLELLVVLHERAIERAKNFKAAKREDKWRFAPPEYKPGDVVMVHFGVGVHTEASYPHPGVVLYNDFYTLVVAPMTHTSLTGDLQIPTTFKGENGTIQLGQIRCISKQRVISKMPGSLRGTTEYEQVREKMLQHFLPSYYKELQELRVRVKDLEEEKKRLVASLRRSEEETKASQDALRIMSERAADRDQYLEYLESKLKELGVQMDHTLYTPAAGADPDTK